MPREQSPAFQFYPADFLADSKVAAMSPTACGVYIRLLCHCWLEGVIPNDRLKLQHLGGYRGPKWDQAWNEIASCFESVSGGLIQPRIERERRKQATFRKMKSSAGQAGGKQTQSRRRAEAQAKSSPPSSSSSSSSISDSKVLNTPTVVAAAYNGANPKNGGGGLRANSKRPIFTGQRFVVFEWMLEDINRILGERQTTEFDVHAWFFDLDARIAKTDIVLQRNDTWSWLQTELVNEAVRRGLKVAQPHHPRLGKQSQRLLAAIENIAATERAAGR